MHDTIPQCPISIKFNPTINIPKLYPRTCCPKPNRIYYDFIMCKTGNLKHVRKSTRPIDRVSHAHSPDTYDRNMTTHILHVPSKYIYETRF